MRIKPYQYFISNKAIYKILRLMILILIINLSFANQLKAQFKVVQNRPSNYSFNIKENAHQLTDGSTNIQATAIWNNTDVKGFEKIDLNFNFLVEAEYYLGYKDKEGADGIAFVLQSQGDNALGSVGVGMGFAKNIYDHNKVVSPSLGIELDTWFNDYNSPPAVDTNPNDHFAYDVDGDLLDRIGLDYDAKKDSNNNAMNIEDSTFHCVKFFWDSESFELSTYLDGQLRKTEVFDGISNSRLTNIIKTNLVYWGFTTGTATRDNIHMVRFDGIKRAKDACFAEIYKDSPYNTTNPNCGLEYLNICENKTADAILFVSTAKMPIDSIVWRSENNVTKIQSMSSNNDKVKITLSSADEISVTIYYTNGCIASDNIGILNKSIKIVNPKDTIILCQDKLGNIDNDILLDGKLLDNSNKVNWIWNNQQYIININSLLDKAQFDIKDKDTVTFIISAEINDDFGNICSDEISITVISNHYYFDNEINYSLCLDSAHIKSNLYIDSSKSILISRDSIKSINWIPPNSNKDFKDSKTPKDFDAHVLSEGLYRIIIELTNGCILENRIYIDFDKEKLDLLPNKLNLCYNDSLLVTSYLEASTYKWSTGDTTRSIWISKEGIYYLEISNKSGCIVKDSVEIVMLPKSNLEIIGETIICKLGNYVDLSVKGTFKDFIWSNNQKIRTIRVNNPGLYWVKATSENGCSVYDSINVVSYDSLYLKLYADNVCNTNTAIIHTNTNSNNYSLLWSNGKNSDSIIVNKKSKYWVELTDNISGCILRDTISIEFTNDFYPKIDGNFNICMGDTAYLEVTGCTDCIYKWMDNNANSTNKFTKNTKGFVIVSKSTSCRDSLPFEVKINQVNRPKINGNLSFCNNDSTMLYLEDDYKSIKWSNGQTGKSIFVDKEGTYSVIVENDEGCKNYDTVKVEKINIKEFISFDKLVDFGKIYLDSIVKIKINLLNSYKTDVDLSYIYNGSKEDFKIKKNYVLHLELKPDRIGNYLDSIKFIINYPCLDSFYVHINGEVFTKVILELPKISSLPGDSINIPIYLLSNLDYSNNYSFTMDYDSTILSFGNLVNNISFTRNINLIKGKQLIENPVGLTLLTDLNLKPLTVDTVIWDNKYIETEIRNGWIKLDTICAHNNRLVQANISGLSLFIDNNSNLLYINRTGDNIGNLINVEIIDATGKILLIDNSNITSTKYYNLESFTTGIYFVKIHYLNKVNLYKFIKIK